MLERAEVGAVVKLVDLLGRVWARWGGVAHVIGNFHARLLLSAFYFTIVPPFALIVKVFKDPLRLRAADRLSHWIERAPIDEPSAAGRRQF